MQRESTPPKMSTLFGLQSLQELSSKGKLGHAIPTGCKMFNEFLSGGIQTGVLTEIYGESGTGKTQFTVQFLLEALYDYEKKTLEGRCVYISTSKHLHEVRYEALIQAFLKRHQLPAQMEVRSLIFGFHTLDVKSFERVIDVEIPKILNSGIQIKAIVIDNIASITSEMMESHDSSKNNMFFERSSFLKSLSTRLKTIAYQNDLAMVLVNNVISAFSEDYKKANKVVPALGMMWSALVNERFKMHKYPDSRKGLVNSMNPNNTMVAAAALRSFKVKLSARLQKKELFYMIDNDGIKGITENI